MRFTGEITVSNTFSPNGFQGVRRLDGASWTASLNTALIAAAYNGQIFLGDPVVLLNTGYIVRDAIGSIPTQGTFGIFVGSKLAYSPTGTPYGWYQGLAQTNDTEAYVITDPNVVFRCWVGTGASSASGGPAIQSSVGANYNWQLGTGNTTSGQSGAYLDFASKGTTSTLPLTIVGLVKNPPGVNGTDITTAGNLVEVVLNQQAYKTGTTGANTSS